MATRDTGQPAMGITRRGFLKASAAATAVAGCGLDFAFDPAKAAAYEGSGDYTVTTTTCPYCSASCGQRVVVDNSTQEVVDIYGDFESPINSGGLCAKGAGSLQLVNNRRRLAAFAAPHPVANMDGTMDNIFASTTDATTYPTGVAWKRVGNQNWTRMDLQTALDEVVSGDAATTNKHLGLKAYRGSDAAGWAAGNSKSVAFFGSSHMNNEPNNLYRKIIANFGTSNVEHQARI